MNNSSKNKQMKTINYLILLASIVLMSSCSTMAKFSISPITPAAVGTAKITQDDNKNYLIEVNVKYLAAADRLTPPAQVYVVWITTDKSNPINLGMLVSNSKNNASLKATTSSKPLQVFVTAENMGDSSIPSNSEIFHTPHLKLK